MNITFFILPSVYTHDYNMIKMQDSALYDKMNNQFVSIQKVKSKKKYLYELLHIFNWES